MRTVLLAAVLAVGLGGLTGCDSSNSGKPTPAAPPPEDSGAGQEKKSRIPAAPPK